MIVRIPGLKVRQRTVTDTKGAKGKMDTDTVNNCGLREFGSVKQRGFNRSIGFTGKNSINGAGAGTLNGCLKRSDP